MSDEHCLRFFALAGQICVVDPSEQRLDDVSGAGLRVQDVVESEQPELHPYLLFMDRPKSAPHIADGVRLALPQFALCLPPPPSWQASPLPWITPRSISVDGDLGIGIASHGRRKPGVGIPTVHAGPNLNPYCRDNLSATTSMRATHARRQIGVGMPRTLAEPNSNPICGIDSRNCFIDNAHVHGSTRRTGRAEVDITPLDARLA